MINRVELMQIQEGFPKGINFVPLKKNIFNFIRLINIKKSDEYEQIPFLLEAKSYLENSMIYLQNLIDPKNNKFVKEYTEEFYLMVANIGRWNKRIDAISQDIVSELNVISNKSKKTVMKLKLKNFRETLREGLENLIFQPLINSIRKLSSSRIAEEEKDSD